MKKQTAFILPRKQKQTITTLLQNRPLENMQAVARIESFLLKTRGYIFRMPQPDTPVIMLSSGGLDSTVASDILMRQYGLRIYPLYIKRGHRRVGKELRSFYFFADFFRRQYPTQYHQPLLINAPIPPREIRWRITDVADAIFNTTTLQRHGIPLYSSLLNGYAVQYARYLELTRGIKIRTVFNSFIAKDGVGMAYETFTALRSVTMNTIVLTNDSSWQIASLALERECGYFWEKETLIQWANHHRMPLEKTWSCYWGGMYHCGRCDGCRTRREAYERAGIRDHTVYWSDLPMGKVQSKIHNATRRITVALQHSYEKNIQKR